MQNWLFLAAIATFAFSIRFNPVSLIPLAILIDGYFGNFHTFPYLSILTIIWFLIVEFLRPRFVHFRTT